MAIINWANYPTSGGGGTLVDTIFDSGTLKSGITLTNFINTGTYLELSGTQSGSVDGISITGISLIKVTGVYTMAGSANTGYLAGKESVRGLMGYGSPLGTGTDVAFSFSLPSIEDLAGYVASGGLTSYMRISTIKTYS